MVATSLISFGLGVAVGAAINSGPCCGWGWNSWGCGWNNSTVVYNRNVYVSNSNTFVNRNNYYNRANNNRVYANNYNRANYNYNQNANYRTNNFNSNRPGGTSEIASRLLSSERQAGSIGPEAHGAGWDRPHGQPIRPSSQSDLGA